LTSASNQPEINTLTRAFKLLNSEDLRFLVLPVLCGLSVTLSLFLIYRSIHQVYQTELFVLKDLSLGLFAILFVAVGIYIERITAEKLAQRVISRLRLSIFQKVLNTSSNDSALHERSSTFLRLTSDMSPVRNWIVHGLVNGIVLVTVLVSILILLYFVHPFLALTALGSIVLLVICSVPLGRKLSQSSQEQRHQRTRLLDRLTAQLTSLPWVLLFNQTKRERRRYHKSNSALVDATLKRATWTGGIIAGKKSNDRRA
jgi:ABC-type multidrug transport system fused ATPase/permease subunit